MTDTQTLHTESTVTNEPATQVIPVLTPTNWTLKINAFALLGLIGSTIIVSIIGTAFTIGGTLNTDHFLLSTTAQAVTEIKSNQELYVRQDVYDANQTAILTSLRDIKNTLDILSKNSAR